LLTADLRIFDAERRQIALVNGLAIREVALDRLGMTSARDHADSWMFRVAWRPDALPEALVEAGSAAGQWLVVGGDSTVADGVARELASRGGSPIVVTADAAPGVVARTLQHTDGSTAPLRGIVHLDGTGIAESDSDRPAGTAAVLRAGLSLVRAASAAAPARSPRLSFVTRGAHSANGSVDGVFQAATWGFARTVALEHPELRPRLIDLDTEAPPSLSSLVDELLADGDDEVALRENGRVIRRLERLPRAADSGGAGIAVRADGTYLVTGGGGALGLRFAEWLVDRGARHVVLVGRREPSSEARAAIERLEQAGAAVVFVCADAGVYGEMSALLDHLGQRMPPLRGIVHAAGVLRDALLVRMTDDDLSGALRPKVDAAWHLHTLTRGLPIDFFVMFSSVAALLGSPGQANYAAGNAFLDALARHRTAAGLPAISINWGPWAGEGMASAMRNVDGVGLIQPAEGLAAFERATSAGAAGVVVMPFAQSAQLAESFARVPILRDLAKDLGDASGTPSSRRPSRDVRASWRAAAETERNGVLAGYLRGEIAAIVRTPVERIDDRSTFATLGVDSLMGLELRDRIGADVGVTVPMATLVQSPTVEGLAEYLMTELTADEALGSGPLSAHAAGGDLLERLDDLSDEEVEALLGRLASDGGPGPHPGVPS
jgi:NAD(P)-dependent dehydrogenase (short-subunit alcohol dehydrogenase family)/acyl carrier protein